MGKIPSPGIVRRKFNCCFYNDCLYRAAIEEWVSFACNDCPLFCEEKVIMSEALDEKVMINNQQPEDSEQCACGKKVISPGSPLCASCMAVKAHEARKAKKKPSAQAKTKKEAHGVAKPGRDDTTLIIEFGKHAPVLREVERQAGEEMRPIDLQVIYILKKHLKG